MSYGTWIITTVAASIAATIWYQVQKNKRRRAYIENYRWPPGLLSKVERAHPNLKTGEINQVGDGLKQFFRAYFESNYRPVAMPSQIADDLWHEFILYTRHYSEFCDKAFGRFLHHTPALVLRHGQKDANTGLRRVWWHSCKLEGIDPKNAKRLPLLFALDAKFNVPNGYHYEADCSGVRKKVDKTRDENNGGCSGSSGGSTGHCGTHFTSTEFDGSTSGLGDGAGDGGGDSGGDGGGCGGD